MRAYPSQLSYGPYGHLICTPASCAVAVSFLVDGLADALSVSRVQDIMEGSHRLVAAQPVRRMMMLSELQERIPDSVVAFIEIAGLTSAPKAEAEVEVDNLVLQPLSTLLQYCHRTNSRRGAGPCALVVTLREHTTCYLLEGGRVFLFDPLPASLTDVTSLFVASMRDRPPVEYSGLLLYIKGPCS